MNKENLLRMAAHIEKVPQERFNMVRFRLGKRNTHKCGSVGCIIGHCVQLDDWRNVPTDKFGNVIFHAWSVEFAKVDWQEWIYLFDSAWVDLDNTPTGAAKRIRYFVEHGLPENWRVQMEGNAPLPYLEK